jgi:hypothetical protein
VIPRSMSFCDVSVAPRCGNGPAGCRRLTGAEAFELEGMDPFYIDIDGFWLTDANAKGPQVVSVTNEDYARFEVWRELGLQSNSGLEPASVVIQLIGRKSSRVTHVAIEQDALGVYRSVYLDRARVYQPGEIPGRSQI